MEQLIARGAALWVALVLFCGSSSAAGFWNVKVVRKAGGALKALSFFEERGEIQDLEIEKQVVPLLKLPGKFTERGVSLLSDNVAVVGSVRKSDDFVLTLPLLGARTTVELSAVQLDGRMIRERIEIVFKDHAKYMAVQTERRSPILGFSPSLGVTYLGYTEDGVAPYSAVMLSGKIGYQFPIAPPAWDAAINVFGNLAPLVADPSGRVARFLGINVRVGYAVPAVRDPWRLGLMAGAYVNQMYVSDNSFGFRNVSGPQFFPVLRRKYSDGRAVYGYFKFAPVAPGGRLRSLGDRELALGVGANWTGPAKVPLSLSLDLSDLAFEITGVAIDCRTATLSLGTLF